MEAAGRIQERLQAEAAGLRRRRLLMLVCGTILLAVAPLLLLGLLDLILPFREGVAFRLWALVAVAGGVLLLWRAWRLKSRLPDRRRVALMAETECPELMDSLVCAVELLEQPTAARTGLREALLKQVDRELAARDLHRLVVARELPGVVMLGLSALSVGALLAVLFLPLSAKARDFLADAVRGEASGLVVTPGNAELAAGSDLQIDVEIKRGPTDEARIIIDAAGELRSYDLYSRGQGRHSFEMYGVDRAFSYYIETPTLRSPRFRVTTFVKPTITRTELAVIPPAYTGRPAQEYPELRNLIVPQGGAVKLTLTTNMAVQARLVTDPADASAPLAATADGTTHELTLHPAADLTYSVELEDRDGHVVSAGAPYRLEILEDLPPVVRVTNPEKESSVHDKDEEVPIMAQVMDDYGVASATLVLNVNGNGWKRVDLFTAGGGPELEKQVAEIVALDGIVDYGDVVSYYVEALDHAEPKPGIGRSELRFLEIRPPEVPPREADGQGQGQELSVADLIIEQKRLIKETFALDLVRDPDRRADLLQNLQQTAGDLYSATRQRFTKIKEVAQAHEEQLGVFEKLFDDTVRDMDRAHDLLLKELPQESIEYQQGVLSHLVKIEIELQKNSMKSKNPEPDSRSGQNSDNTAANEQKKQEEKLAKLNENLQRLKDLGQRQDNLNQRYAKGARDGAKPEERQYLSNKQQELERETAEVNRQLREAVPEAYDATRELSKSGDEMREAGKRVDQDQMANAQRRGEQAKTYLDRSRQLLEELRRELAGNELAEAQQKLDQIRQRQEQLRRRTEAEAARNKDAVDREQARKLADQQGDLQKQYQDLLDRLQKAGEQLEQSNPGAAQELARGLREAEDNGTGSKMKRAENALTYRQMKRAGEYQKEVEDALKRLSENLAKAQEQGPQLSPEELSRMLNQTLENYRALENAEQGQTPKDKQKELRDKVTDDLKEMSDQLEDQKMQELARQAEALGGGSASETLDPEMKKLVAEAAALLERKLLEAAIQRKLKLSRLSGRQPPDEYRKLVQEYFKKLSELAE